MFPARPSRAPRLPNRLSSVRATALGLVAALALAPWAGPVHAQAIPNAGLEDAIGECIGKEGATGDAVGNITLDLKTGKVVYRCDSDPATDQKVLKPAVGEAGPATAGAKPTAPAAKPGEAPKDTPKAAATTDPAPETPPPDLGAAAAYVNTPRGPAPDRPQDCVGAHPYYMTFPVCVMARKMGLLGADKTARPATAEEAPPPVAAPAEGAAPAAADTAHAAPAAEPPGPDAAVAAPLTPAAEPEHATPTHQPPTIGPLPEDASDAAAKASRKVNGDNDQEGARETAAPKGRLAPGSKPREEPTDWVTWAIWGAMGLGGLLGCLLLVIGVLVLVNRARMRRLAEDDDPYAAFFDDPENVDQGEDHDDMDGPDGLFASRDDRGAKAMAAVDDAPLGSFEEGHALAEKPHQTMDGDRAFTA
jgi:hypothetical protein